MGRRYFLPPSATFALERVFEEPVDAVIVIANSRFARAHLGMGATTRPNRIFLARGGEEFVSNPNLLLHEYFHVVRQWRPGRLTRWNYVVESVRCGYHDNSFEREAREFALSSVPRYRQYLEDFNKKSEGSEPA